MKPAAVLTDLDGTLLEHGGVIGEAVRVVIADLGEGFTLPASRAVVFG